MKVLHVIWHLGQGGAQTYLYNLLSLQVADPSLEPRLLVLGDEGELSGEFEELLEVSYLRMRSGLDIARAVRLPGFLGKSDHQLLHSHSNNLSLNLALQISNRPAVYTEHGGGLLGGRKRDLLIYRYLSRPIFRFIAISQEMARVMEAANASIRGRIAVVYNGVDIARIDAAPVGELETLEPRLPGSRFRVGVVGRLEYQKGIDLFIEVAACLSRARDDVEFVIVGDGSLRQDLEQLARGRNVADRLTFLGFRTDALSVLKTLDLFLFTSNYEPFGLVIVESMAAEVPVVAAACPGAVAEIISNNVNGLIVDSRDPAEIAEAVDCLLNDDARRRSFIIMARESVGRQFNIQANAEGVRAAYHQCLGEDAVNDG